MKNQISEFLTLILQSKSFEEMENVLSELKKHLGYDYYSFGYATLSSLMASRVKVLYDVPNGWPDRYREKNYLNVDPLVKYSLTYNRPLDWSNITTTLNLKDVEVDFINEARQYGLVSGFSVPFRQSLGGFGKISFIRKIQKKVLPEDIHLVQILIPNILDKLKTLDKSLTKVSRDSLTKREVECLSWAAEGKGGWEISRILGISEVTVAFHLKNAANKLKANNKYHAITKAILSGAIFPNLNN